KIVSNIVKLVVDTAKLVFWEIDQHLRHKDYVKADIREHIFNDLTEKRLELKNEKSDPKYLGNEALKLRGETLKTATEYEFAKTFLEETKSDAIRELKDLGFGILRCIPIVATIFYAVLWAKENRRLAAQGF